MADLHQMLLPYTGFQEMSTLVGSKLNYKSIDPDKWDHLEIDDKDLIGQRTILAASPEDLSKHLRISFGGNARGPSRLPITDVRIESC